jgi:NAD(P)-dependent dehydrogenase (short-subunit alcohol dehydrogenase family)
MTLTGRAALITGGKRIGAVVAMALAREGSDLAIAFNRSRDEADETAARVRALGRHAVALQADVSDPADCARLVADAVQALGRLDVLVNMASIYRAKPLGDLTSADWDAQLAVDLRASFLCAHAAVPHMRRAGGGRIVNFADWVAASGRPRYTGYVPYYVAKAGVKALTEALALELAQDGILVNAIAPGPIMAPPGTTAEEHAAVARATPVGRWGGEGVIAAAVRYFCDSDFVTGETLRVDGGRHLK